MFSHIGELVSEFSDQISSKEAQRNERGNINVFLETSSTKSSRETFTKTAKYLHKSCTSFSEDQNQLSKSKKLIEINSLIDESSTSSKERELSIRINRLTQRNDFDCSLNNPKSNSVQRSPHSDNSLERAPFLLGNCSSVKNIIENLDFSQALDKLENKEAPQTPEGGETSPPTPPQISERGAKTDMSATHKSITGEDLIRGDGESQGSQKDNKKDNPFAKVKEEYKQNKLQIIQQLQKEKGLQTKECRKAILLCLLDDYNQMEKKTCFTSNERLLIRLQEFYFDVNERTLKRDLKELRDENLIEVKVDRYQNEYCQVRTARSIKTSNKTTEILNTFCPVDNNLDSYKIRKIRNIVYEISNKFIKAKTSLQNEVKRIKRWLEIKKAEKQQSGKPLNVHEVVEYFISELRKPASKAIDFFNWYSKRGWLDSGGKAISSWRGIATVWG